jgi:hypothetical protein
LATDTEYFGVHPVDYRVNEYRYAGVSASGQTSWPFNYAIGFVDVYVDGIKVPTTGFTATDGAMVNMTGVATGSFVELVSRAQVNVSSWPTSVVIPGATLTNGTTLGASVSDALTVVPASITWSAPVTTHSGNHTFTNVVSVPAATAGGNATNLTQVNNAISAAITAISFPTAQGVFRNLKLSANGSSSYVNISADEVVLGDGTGKYLTVRSLTASASTITYGVVNGVEGTAVAAVSTWYSVWVISNGSTVGAFLSLSATAPTLPAGYTYKTRVGWIKTNASGYPAAFKQYGRKARWTNTGSGLPLLIGGTGAIGSVSAPTWVSVDALIGGPSTAMSLAVILTGTGSTNGQAIVAPSTSYGGYNSVSNPAVLTYTTPSAANLNMAIQGEVVLESNYLYAAHSGGLYLFAYGWEDNL